MSTVAISGLPAGTSASGSDVFPYVQSGTTKQITYANLFTNVSLTTPALGTPASGTLTSCTGLPIIAGTTGTLSVARGGTGTTSSTGSGNVVLSTSPTLVTPVLGVASATSLSVSGVIAATSGAPTIGSSTTIAPTTLVAFVSGTTAIATITPPSPISTGGGMIILIPTGLWTTNTTGNIALGSTAVVSKALIMTYDVGTNKWYPSY